MSKIMDDEGRSEIILQRILALKKEHIIIPTFLNFSPPTEYHDLIQDWQNGLKLSIDKFLCQVGDVFFTRYEPHKIRLLTSSFVNFSHLPIDSVRLGRSQAV